MNKHGKDIIRVETKIKAPVQKVWGICTVVEPYRQINYTLDDDRTVQVLFVPEGADTAISVEFEAEQINTLELQHSGWQAILDNFKKYAETHT
jgi:uncharacterized protein YndB with AHSA1/START domain